MSGREAMRALGWAADEVVLPDLMMAARLTPAQEEHVRATTVALVVAARAAFRPGWDVGSFLQRYSLTEPEGVALLQLAEALLRVPDAATADALISEFIGDKQWARPGGTWTMAASGRLLRFSAWLTRDKPGGVRDGGITSAAIRSAMRLGMRHMARQFVWGRDIGEALRRSRREGKKFRYSFDMLGESARSLADADRYLASYARAIDAVAQEQLGLDAEISVKLSALYPRYEELQRDRCVPVLVERLLGLAIRAKTGDVGLIVDAEEADRLELSLDVFEAVLGHPALAGWDGLGLAVQAYQKRALAVVDYVADVARRTGHRVAMRLVKGAYWDNEIKFAQQHGHADYPVFTRKAATDVSWVACMRRMLAHSDAIRPAFATHNARSLATALELAAGTDFEMQRLHGMGAPLYEDMTGTRCPVRIYAPVGAHEDLLPYLVRRLLENGANANFVHDLFDHAIPADGLAMDPVAVLEAQSSGRDERIPMPRDIYPGRVNAAGFNLADRAGMARLQKAMQAVAMPRVVQKMGRSGAERVVVSPADRRVEVGRVREAAIEDVDAVVGCAVAAWRTWDAAPAARRADILERVAALIEQEHALLLALLAREAGRVLPDAIGELREAVDFCRYYAQRARADFVPRVLPGITGEENIWQLSGRGVFACISPWNFPLSIFTGQIAAALVAGNAVVAKPAEQTPLIAGEVVRLFHMAGVPEDVLQLICGDGAVVGARLVADERIAGVAFTGGTETARRIALILAQRRGAIVPFVAETGGINAMIVDSTALPEQVVGDVLNAAFGSAGQRCSALRLLCVQAEIAPRVLNLLREAAEMLRIGDPVRPEVDIGPVIDREANESLTRYTKKLGKPFWQATLPNDTTCGCYNPPVIIELESAAVLNREVFGPVLHVLSFDSKGLDSLMNDVASHGFGLTLGIHSRRRTFQERVARGISVGNTYVNRAQVGAVVGAQPFGGLGMSGTGPKAGGPLTLYLYAEEKVLCVNTTAACGNLALLASDKKSRP